MYNSLQQKIKSTHIAYLFWFLFGSHYAYFGKWNLQFLFWLTFGGFGFWALLDFFIMPIKVDNVNAAIIEMIEKIESDKDEERAKKWQ